MKKEKEKKSGALTRGPRGKTGKGPREGSTGSQERSKETKHTGREQRPTKGGFKKTPGQKFTGNQMKKSPGKAPTSSSSFRGEMVDPSKKAKKNKGLKKKHKAGKPVHI